MQLLYVNNTDPQDGGGGDRRLFEEAVTLADRGADVLAIASRTDPGLSQERTVDGVEIRTVKCVPDRLQRFPTLHFYLARSLFPFISLPILVWTLSRMEIDVVIDNHTPHPSLVPLLGPIFSVPVVALVHEYHDRSALQKYPLPIGTIQLLVQNLLRIGLYSAVIVPREQTKEQLRDYGVHIPIHVVPNGIEFDEYSSPPKDISVQSFDFLVVSRLVHRKGIDQLLSAMADVVEERPSAQLGIAGSGPEREKLERLASELGIESNIEFLGYVSEDRKIALLHESDVFVLPSRQEGFGIAVLEAMAAGTPVVASDLDIIESLVPNDPNRLAKASDSEEFSTAMDTVLNQNGVDQSGICERNQQEAEQYSLQLVGSQANTVYEQVHNRENHT